MTDIDAYMAAQKARVRAISERAARKLEQRDGELRSLESLTDGLSAVEIEKDAASMKRILNVWKRTGKGGPGSIIGLPSGRRFRAPGDDDHIATRELAVPRTPKHLRPKRRTQG